MSISLSSPAASSKRLVCASHTGVSSEGTTLKMRILLPVSFSVTGCRFGSTTSKSGAVSPAFSSGPASVRELPLKVVERPSLAMRPSVTARLNSENLSNSQGIISGNFPPLFSVKWAERFIMHRAWLALAAIPLFSCAAFAGVDQGLLNLVPPASKVLSGVQVDKSKDSPFGQYLLNRMHDGDSGLENFVQSTGFDPRRDVQELLFATTGDPTQMRTAVLARGYFDAAKIKAMALSHGGQIESIQGIDVLRGGEKSHGAIAVLEPTIAVAGDRALVESIVRNRKQPSLLESPELAEKAQTVSSAGQAWFV